jgi:hypothetical protein
LDDSAQKQRDLEIKAARQKGAGRFSRSTALRVSARKLELHKSFQRLVRAAST